MKKSCVIGLSFFLLFGLAGQAVAVPVFFGPTSYLSSADIPAGFYSGGSPTFLEDFEDGTLDGGMIASTGSVIPPGWVGLIDSVDADDGSIDGSGSAGHSWFYSSGSTGVTFTFQNAVTAAGIVWTDGAGSTTFQAYRGATLLGSIQATVATSGYTGQTDEDSFFGVQDMDGITSIRLSNSSGGIELDHVQYGDAATTTVPTVPEPATLVLMGLGLAGVGFSKRRKWL